MAISIVLGVAAIRRGEIARHRWMMRGYALGTGRGHAGTDLGFGEVAFGPPGELSRADLIGARWAIKPRRGRVGHPRAVGPCSRQRMEAAYRAQSFVLYRECGDDVLGAIS